MKKTYKFSTSAYDYILIGFAYLDQARDIRVMKIGLTGNQITQARQFEIIRGLLKSYGIRVRLKRLENNLRLVARAEHIVWARLALNR